METTIVVGSISDIAKTQNLSLAESFLNCEMVILVDTSGSMGQRDSRGGKSRYAVACEELAYLQAQNPGRILVISFSDSARIDLGGVPHNYGGGTMVSKALIFAKDYDLPGIRFILLSDGEPFDEQEALSIAGKYQNKISCVYVGPEEYPVGRDFLQRLSAATGGQTVTADRAKELARTIQTLLLN